MNRNMENVNPAPWQTEDNEQKLPLLDYLQLLWFRRKLIIAITLVAMLIGGFKAFTAVPIYQADGLLQVEEKSGGLANLDVSSMLEDYAPVNAEIEILRSRSVLGEVVDNLRLDISATPDLSVVGAALARRAPVDERPMIKVDTLDLPDYMRGSSMKLVVSGANGYALYDTDDKFLLQGTVGEAASLDLGSGDSLTLFVSALQGDQDQAFWLQRWPRVMSIEALQSSLKVSERGDWSHAAEEANDPVAGLLMVHDARRLGVAVATHGR